MKKLMIVAMIAAAGSVFAACTPGPGPANNQADVYRLKLTGKTTQGVKTTIKGDKPSLCTPGGQNETKVPRQKASLAIEGWLLACPFACNAVTTEAATDKAFWQTKPYKTGWKDNASLAWTVWQVIGAKQNAAEAAGTFEGTASIAQGVEQKYTLTLAGLGSYKGTKSVVDQDDNEVKWGVWGLSGNFAGTASYSWYIKGVDCLPTIVWDCADLAEDLENKETVAFGSWTLKRDSSASKKYLSKGVKPAVKYLPAE